MASNQSLLIVQGLRYGWPGQPALFDDLDIEVGPGLTWLTGDDGCGKSSLLALIAGALPAQAGHLRVAGHEWQQDPAAYRRQVFWIDPQTDAHDALPAAAFLDSLSAHWPHLSGVALADLVDGFALGEHLPKPLYMLSTGSRRKLWLTAAFAAGAPLTLIDQPFAALDAASVAFLGELLQDVSGHPARAWLVADHAPAPGVPGRQVLRLGAAP
jgi:ABC-type transport system involved in cytochrome c biogenesis ATPase subunit